MEMKEIYEQYFNTVYGYLMTLTGGNQDLSEGVNTGNILSCHAENNRV